MTNKENYFFKIFFLIYLFTGVYLSLKTGISHDEYHEQLNWEKNVEGIISFLSTGEYQNLIDYIDKYHGIGFHYISIPFQKLFNGIVYNFNDISQYGSLLVAKHSAVFFIFTISGYFYFLINFKVSQDLLFSKISTIIYLLYPYLFGHAQFNLKDIPFLSFWIICSYFFLNIIEDLYLNKKIKLKSLFFLSFLTAFLISIRISGLIIFIQYSIGLIMLFNYKEFNLKNIILKNISNIFISLFLFLIFVYILNPIAWHNPFEIINSLEWMSKYYHDTCTLTLGECMKSLNLPSSYYFIWLFFKLPLIIIFGIFLFPLCENKILSNKNILTRIYYLIFLITPLIIILIFILKNVAIYDEIRHIMFLVPLFFITSLFNIYIFNKKLFYSLSFLTLIFFILENIALKPYQYTWLNSFAKFTNIEKNFEIDYWGISNKKLQKEIIKDFNTRDIDKNICVFGDAYTKDFLSNSNFSCFKIYSETDAETNRPFYAYKNVRNVKRSDPKDCELIFNEGYKYTFLKKKISTGTLWFCD